MEHPILKEIKHTRGKTMKRHGSVEGYKYVRIVSYDNEKTYRAEIDEFKVCKSFANARDAAIYIDKKLLENGKEPVNILKRKSE